MGTNDANTRQPFASFVVFIRNWRRVACYMYHQVYYTIKNVMLFHKNTQKAVKYIWIVIAVLVILSMVLFYAPVF